MPLTKDEARKFDKAKQLWERAKYDEAYEIVRPVLDDNPFNASFLALGGVIYEKAENLPVAYHLFKSATQVEPNEANHWVNLGRVAEDLWRTQEAERYYKIALKKVNRDETLRILLGNLAALCIDNARYEEAEKWCNKALAKFPDFRLAKSNLGFAQLALGKWNVGWANYRHALDTPTRTKFQYDAEPEWDGSEGKRVVLYGEQGIGDELSFASMVPDAIERCEHVVIDCDLRLAHLFARSFPKAHVYGTRKMPHDCLFWAPEDRDFDSSLAMGQIGEYFRQSPDDCPGTPYLVPDADRVLMWKALWAKKRKPVIGIAWNGGIAKTGAKFRRWTLEQLLPVLKSIDAHWVCLEYKSAAAQLAEFKSKHPEIDIHEYPHATLTKDYDDTAALVASLDMVFCIQTSVAHLGSALGVPTWVCVPPTSQWRYGATGESVPWYKSMRVIRQEAGMWNFESIGRQIADQFQPVLKNAA
jgi:tetratricopeptide (TPR) repeat protein